MATLVEFHTVRSWQPACSVEEQSRAIDAVENGNVIYLPRLAFDLLPGEQRFLDPAISDRRAKNISYDPATGSVSGTSLRGKERLDLAELVGRFSRSARALIECMLPDYAPHLRTARTSFRPVEVQGRKTSSKKDDTRLHVDAFASSPNQGRRLLRVFCNINPEGRPRDWLIGGRFEPYAERFLPKVRRQLPLEARLLNALRITKSVRTPYDHLMLGLHDGGKADDAFQADPAKLAFGFPAGSTWICFTDITLHAALGGQFLLEQTFLLPVDSMRRPERSPLRILERLCGHRLVDSEAGDIRVPQAASPPAAA